MEMLFLGFAWGLSVSVFNYWMIHRYFLRSDALINHLIVIVRLLLIVLAMTIAWRFGNHALAGTAIGLLSLFPFSLWRAWRGK